MKILISTDIEGVAGVFHTEQTRAGNGEYERARRLMTDEANAAIAVFGGTTFTSVAVAGTESATSSLKTVTDARVTQGATMNNAQFAIQAKQAAYENQMAAKSRIMDADFAQETSNLSRFQVLQQAGTAMIAQANAIPQNVLALLR